MSWDDIKENDSDFTKIEAGKSVRVHLLGGEPKKSVTHFLDGKGKKPQPCTGAGCELCAAGNKQRISFSAEVYSLDAKKKQTLEQGIMVWKQVKKIKEAYGGDLNGVDLMISREGGGPTDTKYTVVPVPTKFTADLVTSEDVPF